MLNGVLARFEAPYGVMLLVSLSLVGCGEARHLRHPPARSAMPTGAIPSFHAQPVQATVRPRSGGIHTVFRIQIHAPQPVGVTGSVRRDYVARVMLRRSAISCIEDTGPSFGDSPNGQSHRLTIVLDPAQMMVGHWCRGTFVGKLRYYQDYACPPRGRCHPPRGFPRRSHVVARLRFRVGMHR
jgi:hypothetical protein